MSQENPERNNDAPPPVPEEYRRENPYGNFGQSSWPEPGTGQSEPKPYFNPYAVGKEPPPAPFNPYKVSAPNPYVAPAVTTETVERPPYQEQQVSQVRAHTYPVFWTYALLGAIGLMFVVQIAIGGGIQGIASLTGGFDTETLVKLGAMQNALVREGEWWRLITVMFLHASLLHILFNGLALYSIGRQLELLMGPRRFLIIYFLSGVAGSLLSLGLDSNPNSVGVGASGAIFGLLGGLIGFFFRHRYIFGQVGRSQLNSLLITVAINFVILINIPQVNNLAHLGGLLGGVFLGYFLPSDYSVNYRKASTSSKITLWWAAIALSIGLVVLYIVFMNNAPAVTAVPRTRLR